MKKDSKICKMKLMDKDLKSFIDHVETFVKKNNNKVWMVGDCASDFIFITECNPKELWYPEGWHCNGKVLTMGGFGKVYMLKV